MKIIRILSLLIFAIVVIGANTIFAKENTISVVNISSDAKPGYAIYWTTEGNVTLERSSDNGVTFKKISEVNTDHYLDFDVKKGESYTYRIGGNIATAADDLAGKSVISGISIEAGTTSKSEASVVVSFKTDKLAKTQVFYGETANYGNQTELSDSLNQSHTILIEKLKPNTTYHFKLKSVDKSDQNSTESEDQSFTTPAPPTEKTILEIIIEALSRAFAGFESWMNS